MFKLIPFVVLLSVQVFAKSDLDIAVACQESGTKKIVDQAYNFGCYVDKRSVFTVGYEDRDDKTSQYVWYSAQSYCSDTGVYEIRRVVRYSFDDGKCY